MKTHIFNISWDYQDKIPFVPSLLVTFHKCLTAKVLEKINEMIIDYNTQNIPSDRDDNGRTDNKNPCTLIIDFK